jgi:two-component system sensor histidine kinase KdpD
LRFQARVSGHREGRAQALYELARELSGLLDRAEVLRISDRHIESTFHAKATILLPGFDEKLRVPGIETDAVAPKIDLAVAQWVFDNGKPAGFATDTLPGTPVHYAPLPSPMRTRGVLALEPEIGRLLLIPEQRRLLETFAALIAIALERVHYVEIAQDALVKIESERLRNSILSALSHDLRTPLTVLVGLADSLALAKPALAGAQLELAHAMRDEAMRMSSLVDNLLDMARLESGEVRLNLQWQPLEEVVGSAVKSREHLLSSHIVEIRLPKDLPLVRFDAVLIERVLANLLENAGKYTQPGSRILIEAAARGTQLEVAVADNGPGLAPGSEETVFEKFTRGRTESATPGIGLGLAICRAIVEAHRGRIQARNEPRGGVRFTFFLPLGTPPAPPVVADDAGAGLQQAVR